MNIAVTGASGHLGGVLCRRLLDAGHTVTAIDVQRTAALEGLDCSFIEANVLDRDAIDSALRGHSVVCHLAAVISVVGDPTGIVEKVNVEGPAIVADAAMAQGIRRFVHCSSVHAYDLAHAQSPLTESAERSISGDLPAYDRSKWGGEQSIRKRIEAGLDAVVVNPTGVIGPYDFGSSRMGQVFLAIRDENLPATIDGGFDWVDVRDVANGIVSAIDNGVRGQNYLLSGHRVSIPDLATYAAAVTGARAPPHVVPRSIARMWGPIGTRLARRNESALSMTSESLHALFNGPEVSSDKAHKELGYAARPFEDTVSDIYDWFQEAGI